MYATLSNGDMTMRYKTLAAAVLLALSLPSHSIAQTAKPGSKQECVRQNPPADPAAMQGCMTHMRGMMEKARQAKSAAERQAMMVEHMNMMQGQMEAMRAMREKGADGAPSDPLSQMKMMQQHMDMMQGMMTQMLDQQDMMMKSLK